MNPAILSHNASDNWVPLNNSYYVLLQRLLVQAGESADKYAYLKPGCGAELRFKVEECRKHEWVAFLVAAYTAGVDPATLPDLGACENLIWTRIALLSTAQNAGMIYQTNIVSLLDDFATVTIDPTGVNNSIVFTAKQPGAQGNDITVRYLDPGGVTSALTVLVNGKDITVRLGRAASAINTTATLLRAAIAANAAANALVGTANAAANDGTGLVTAIAETSLAGGSDSLDMVETAAGQVAFGTIYQFVVGGDLKSYLYRAGTDAESSPGIIRPNDYATQVVNGVWEDVTP